MNGAQDLGGMQGFGPIDPEPNEPVFHAEWEKRAFALTVAMGFTGQWNIDISRHARESLNPAQYLSSTYYQIWFAGLQKLLVQRELASRDEIASGSMTQEPVEVAHILSAPEVVRTLGRGGPSEREDTRHRRLCRRRPGPRPQHQPARPHPPAPLRPRPQGCHRSGAWLSCIP